MKYIHYPLILLFLICTLSACSYFETGQIQNVGFITDAEIDNNPWTEQGYQAMLEISDEYDINVYYEENVETMHQVQQTVDQFVHNGVNLIYGHSNIYGEYFMTLAESYPDVQFVYVNGGESGENVTSLNFNAHAMGFFAGMVAGNMTESNQIGIIAAYSWQPETEGFFEGVIHANKDADISLNYINDWNNNDLALEVYAMMKEQGVDVFYPIGDAFSESILREAENDNFYAIGYMTDQMDVAPDAVLTSTIQHIRELYKSVADDFNSGDLEGKIYTYDFKDGFISLGEFHSAVPNNVKMQVEEDIEAYIDTGLLPNEY
ncbi:BMP family ABC transporter substrate-binding protein [Oceanobacillus jeddahense]|uniref:BMP family ABC transporter substrate-binding protein n=1 Tax=Oceanobacillus jeddahense TaxID=1462527 RepID=A0ABY5JSE7_9BACI|nr:BMP family ABC transporter substrate-binding protein [Oceanobacillus jeddahense]UUI01807.1 BMP family ABC transporter substrate-binding protein [Oceanobacillus jeddahense]